jgi:hypothetical protein
MMTPRDAARRRFGGGGGRRRRRDRAGDAGDNSWWFVMISTQFVRTYVGSFVRWFVRVDVEDAVG